MSMHPIPQHPIPQPILPPLSLAPEGAVAPLAPEGDVDLDAAGADPFFAPDDDDVLVPPPEPLFPHQFPLDNVDPNAPAPEMPASRQMDDVWDRNNTTIESYTYILPAFDVKSFMSEEEAIDRVKHLLSQLANSL